MEIKKPAMAGTLESSDCMVTVEPGEDGIEFSLESAVIHQYGNQIRKVAMETLRNLGVGSVRLSIVDKGALDCTIRARIDGAVYRAVGQMNNLPWGGAMLITIQVSREADALRLKISDNGVGMPPEVLQKVMQHITAGAPVEKPQPGASSFIGLRNVYERIKLYYGPQAAMDITSRPMLYTRVQLTIPCKKTV